MIDGQELQRLIDIGRSFRIGARGICINCLRDGYGWKITIPRAKMRSLNCDSIHYEYHDNLLVCGVECGYVSSIEFDLEQYDKLTVIS